MFGQRLRLARKKAGLSLRDRRSASRIATRGQRADRAAVGVERCGCHATRPTAAGGGGEEPGAAGGRALGERLGQAEAVVGRLVEPGLERSRPTVSMSDGQARGRGPARVLEGCSGPREPR